VHLGALEVTFVPAHHWSRRGLFDHCATLWGGFVLTVPGGVRVYHAGDSAYGLFFASIGARYPGIDVAMLPVGAYAPRWFMRNMHMDPAEAVQARKPCGSSPGRIRKSQLSRIEHGERVLNCSAEIVGLATALQIAPGDLTSMPGPAPGNGKTDVARETAHQRVIGRLRSAPPPWSSAARR
jgi:hypothetical protein